jgi:hypothetical protein
VESRHPPGTVHSPSDLTDRTKDFTGREWVFDRLDAFLAGNDRTFLIIGGPGTGKSAIAARLVEMNAGNARAKGHSNLGPGFLFHTHFCRANDPNQIRPSRFVENLSSHLGSAFEPCQEAIRALERMGSTNVSVTVKARRAEAGAQVIGIGTLNVTIGEGLSPTDAFLDLVAAPLRALEGDHRPIVILVDALDEALAYAPDTESRTISGLLGAIMGAPDILPPTVRFILTTRPDKRVLRPLRRKPDVNLDEDAPAGFDDLRDYARARFETSAALAAKAELLAAKVAKASGGNFLYAYYVIEEVLEHPRRADDVDALKLPEDLGGIYREFLGRELARDGASWEDRYRPVLGVLAVARGDGLTAEQIAGASGLTRSQLAGPLRASAQYLSGPEPDGPYRIYHQSFREFLIGDPYYRVDLQEANQAVAQSLLRRFAGNWLGCTDSYSLSHTPSHFVEAIRSTEDPAVREKLAHELTTLVNDSSFLDALDDTVEDPSTPLRDLESALSALASGMGISAMVEVGLGLTALRRQRRQPDRLFDLARNGEVARAEKRLDSWIVEDHWRQAALLICAWLAESADRSAAIDLLGRVRPVLVHFRPLERLAERVAADLTGSPLSGMPLPPEPPEVIGRAIVERIRGTETATSEAMVAERLDYESERALQGVDWIRYRGNPLEDFRDYQIVLAAEREGPVLVALAIHRPDEGNRHLRQYIAAHASNNYAHYRNRSLWALFSSVLIHPDQQWLQSIVTEIVGAALAGASLDFDECVPSSLLALRAVNDPEARQVLDSIDHQASLAVENMKIGRGADPWSAHKRRLAALAEGYAVALHASPDADRLLRTAVGAPFGFAGFQYQACLLLAEAVLACGLEDWNLIQRLNDMALEAAHHVQDPILCVRATSRVNAMVRHWWPQPVVEPPLDLAASVQELASLPGAPTFSAVHVVGESFLYRGSSPIDMPDRILRATTLRELAESVYERPLTELIRLNANRWKPDADLPEGTEVRIPDPELLPVIAARLAAEALARKDLPVAQRVRALQLLASPAARNPTALDTVLGRLLLAARPQNLAILGALQGQSMTYRAAGGPPSMLAEELTRA